MVFVLDWMLSQSREVLWLGSPYMLSMGKADWSEDKIVIGTRVIIHFG